MKLSIKGVALTTMWLLAMALAACEGGGTPPAPPAIEVSVIQAAEQPVTVYRDFVAQTQAPSEIEIRSQVTGLLQRQAFADGERVAQGDLLYVIDPRPFRNELAQARANLAQAQADLTNARQTRERYDELVGQGFVSKQAYQNAVAQERSAAAVVAAQRALVEEARINLGYTEIRAPRAGFMSESRVRPGALVSDQATLLNTLYSSDPMWVYFTVSEDELLSLQKQIEAPASGAPPQVGGFRIRLADGSEYLHSGKLDFVDAAVDPQTGTLQARVSVPNPDRVLRPGMFVRLSVPAMRTQAIRVPQQAVTELQGLKMVYVVGPDGKPEQREIAATTRAGNDWVVEKGLAPGEMVIVEGVQKVQMMPNAPVKPVLVAQGDATAHGAAGGPGAQEDRPPSVSEPRSGSATPAPSTAR